MMDGMGIHGWTWIVVLLLLAILGGIVVLIGRSGRGGKAGAALVALAIPAFVAACGGRGAPDPAGSPSPAARETPDAVGKAPAGMGSAQAHPIRGRIEAIAADRRAVTLDHEAVPGVMDAMTMEYKVPGPSILQGLAVGDRVQGHFEARPGGEYVITHLAK